MGTVEGIPSPLRGRIKEGFSSHEHQDISRSWHLSRTQIMPIVVEVCILEKSGVSYKSDRGCTRVLSRKQATVAKTTGSEEIREGREGNIVSARTTTGKS